MSEGFVPRVPSPLVELLDERLASAGVRLWLKRDDLIHPAIPGNKWRKLKHNLAAAQEAGHDRLLTFGGAYSNHVRATAAAGHYFGFSTVGVIRGEERLPLNPVLEYATSVGMSVEYLDRSTYRRKMDSDVIEGLRQRWGDFYLLPEGGSNDLAVRGCAEIVSEINQPFDVICCPCGTGGTLAGIASSLDDGQRAIGFAALKGATFLIEEVRQLQTSAFGGEVGDWSVDVDHHFGGFAKSNLALQEFIAEFDDRHGITLEWIYVAKMIAGIFDLIAQGEIPAGSRVVAVVTG